MKYSALLILFLLPFVLFAQHGKGEAFPSEGIYAQKIEAQQARQVFCRIALPDVSDNVQQKVLSAALGVSGFNALPAEFVASSVSSNALGTHYTFSRKLDGREVFPQFIKAYVDKSSTLRQVAYFLEGKAVQVPDALNIESVASRLNLDGDIKASSILYYNGTYFESLVRFEFTDPITQLPYRGLYNRDGACYYKETALTFGRGDTTIRARVHFPDPLTSAKVEYGGKYTDNNDSNTAELEAELREVHIRAGYDTGYFNLSDSFFYFNEVMGPYDTQPVLPDTNFIFNRSDNGFEYVNILYHLQTFRKIVHDYGFTDLPAFEIQIDAHGLNGWDESGFGASYNPPALIFGIGGIDDGEDADVVVHEFGHALSESAAPETNLGLERKSIDEGNSDYFAMSYSRRYNLYNWTKVYNWDGNYFSWQGRRAISGMIYPDSLTSSHHRNAEIWFGALTDIYLNLGQGKTDSLVLASMYTQFKSMTFTQMARNVLQIDSVFNGAANWWVIHSAFVNKGILQPSSVAVTPLPAEKVAIFNSLAFAYGDGDLRVVFPEAFTGAIEVWSIDGKLISRGNIMDAIEYHLDPDEYKKGPYLIHVKGTDLDKSFRVIRY